MATRVFEGIILSRNSEEEPWQEHFCEISSKLDKYLQSRKCLKKNVMHERWTNARLLFTYQVIPSFVHVCIYFEWFSPVAIFRTGFSFVEYCSGSFRAFLQSDY